MGSQKGGYQQGNPYFTGTQVDGTNARSWGGVALYSNYAFSDKAGFGARYEVFDNTNGARALVAADGSGVSVNSLTFTGNFTVADGHLLLKPELRVDSYSKNKFIDGDGKLTRSQTTLGLAAIFKY